jgi:HAD superfamily hydrolase (TIGR01490 family)
MSTAAAFFDLEKTLSRHAVEMEVARHFYRRGLVPRSVILRAAYVYLKYNLGLISNFEELKQFGAWSFKGWRPADFEPVFAEIYDAQLRSAIFEEARREIERLKQDACKLYIVSSTYRFIVGPFAEELGFDGYYGCELETLDGRCTGRLTGTVFHQEKKADVVREIAAREGLSLEESWAFGDREQLLQLGNLGRMANSRRIRLPFHPGTLQNPCAGSAAAPDGVA